MNATSAITTENLLEVLPEDVAPLIPPKEDDEADIETPSLTNTAYHTKLLNYLTARLESNKESRLRRVRRFARTDQMISTWQKLSPEDSIREAEAENSGKSQGIPLNVPLTKANLEDTTSFFAEIFAPIGGNFYASPTKRDVSASLQLLTKKMNEDSKHNAYYAEVAQAMSSLFKYNLTGFLVEWSEEAELDRGVGNRTTALDLYNFFYDDSVQDVHKLHAEGEWSAIAEVKSRLWLVRKNRKENLENLDKVLLDTNPSNHSAYGTAKYYRNPPAETNIESDGSDSKSGHNDNSSASPNFDWDSIGLGDNSEPITIPGYEVVTMFCWISKKQFKIPVSEEEGAEDLGLFKFRIVNGDTIISMTELTPVQNELPTYLSRMDRDELREASRSAAEHIKPFQSFVSFLLNTHIAGVRSNIWGYTVYDPNQIDGSKLKPGDVSGMIPLKQTGKDVRSAFARIRGEVDTRGNLADAGMMMDFIKQFYPNQALPSQVAGIDRAVSNQVSTIVQGATRKMNMFCRIVDAGLMRNVRGAQFNNLQAFDSEKAAFKQLKAEEISNLLNSGLGQLNREAAAAHIKDMIFTLTQNPEVAATIDMQGLYTLYSAMLTIGFDLGELVKQQPQQPSGEGGAQPGPEQGVQPSPEGMIPV